MTRFTRLDMLWERCMSLYDNPIVERPQQELRVRNPASEEAPGAMFAEIKIGGPPVTGDWTEGWHDGYAAALRVVKDKLMAPGGTYTHDALVTMLELLRLENEDLRKEPIGSLAFHAACVADDPDEK